jgi:hypothetical protein
MTAREAGRRRFPVGATYVLLCTGLATSVGLEIAPTWSFVGLLVLLLPFSIVGFALLVNAIVLAADGLPAGWTGTFVASVAVLAVLQLWMFRAIARNWRAADPEVRPRPVTTGADTGL